LLLTGLIVTTNALADEYSYEVGFSFDNTERNGSQSITTPGGTSSTASIFDTDFLSVFGSWYFSGLTDDKGPRARAAFVDRASSVNFGYTRSNQEAFMSFTTDDPNFPFPPPDELSFDSDGDTFEISLRYVDRDSGWYGTAGLIQIDDSARTLFSVQQSAEAAEWRLGVGKYMLETTTLGIEVAILDSNAGRDGSVVAVVMTHLGDFAGSWQYAVDLGYSHTDFDFNLKLDTWAARFSLYPTRNFEIGVALEDVSENGNSRGIFDTTGVEGFASWYVTPNVSLSAQYRDDDVEYLGLVLISPPSQGNANQESYGIAATIRF
jgi:hypothetical protein